MGAGEQEDICILGKVGQCGGSPTIPQPDTCIRGGYRFYQVHEGFDRAIEHHRGMGEGRAKNS